MTAQFSNWNELLDAIKHENEAARPFRGGKKYTTVAVRNELTRRFLGDYIGISTDIVQWGDAPKSMIVVKATIRRTSDDRILATGHAEEIRGVGQVNSTSALENAETSAIGRALAALGCSGGEFASLNELEGVERKKAVQTTGQQPIRNTGPSAVNKGEWQPYFDEDGNPIAVLVPPHDPETGEIIPPQAAPEPQNGGAGGAIRDAWEDAIRDSLPEGYTQRQFDEARAGQLAAEFLAYGTAKGLEGGWMKYWRALSELELGAPDLYANLVAVKARRRRELESAPKKPMLTKAVGEKITLTIRLCGCTADLDKYRDELAEGDLAFALDHPKIVEAFAARRRVLAENESQPIMHGEHRVA